MVVVKATAVSASQGGKKNEYTRFLEAAMARAAQEGMSDPKLSTNPEALREHIVAANRAARDEWNSNPDR